MRQRMRPWAFAAALAALVAVAVILFFVLASDRSPRGVTDSTPAAAPDREATGPESRTLEGESRITSNVPIRPKSDTLRAGITGRVVDEDGASVAGATITLDESRRPESAAGSPILQLRSDRDGRFEVADVDVPVCDIVAHATGFGWRALRDIQTEPGQTVDVTLILAPRPERLGRVLDSADEGVPDAVVTIRLGQASGFGFWRLAHVFTPTSGPGGWFRFPGSWHRSHGQIRISAGKQGVGAGTATASALEDHEIVTVKLLPTRTLTCRFAPDDGSPAPAGLKFQALFDDFHHDGIADERGEGRVPGLPAIERIVITVDDARWEVPGPPRQRPPRLEFPSTDDVSIMVPLTRRNQPEPKAEATTAATPPRTWELEVAVLGVDGLPAANAAIVVECADCPSRDRQRSTTDASGRVSFSEVPFDRALVGVDPTSVGAGVGIDDDFQSVITPYLGHPASVKIQLRPEVVFRGVVKLEDGTPVEGTVTFSRDGRVKFGRTNAQGEFTLRMRSAFDYKLFEISRIVVPTGSDHPVLERFVPVERLPLKPGGDPTIIVEPRS